MEGLAVVVNLWDGELAVVEDGLWVFYFECIFSVEELKECVVQLVEAVIVCCGIWR